MTIRGLFLGLFLLSNLLLSACGGSGHTATSMPFASASDSGAALSSTYVPAGSGDWPLFVYPQAGDPNVDTTRSITWTAANNARAYELQIGTTLGGNDVFDSGVITATSVAMPPLPASVVLYARVRAILNGWGDASPDGHWSRGSYTKFRTDDQTPASTFTNVATGKTLPAGAPVEWSASPLAVGYRLVVTGAILGNKASWGIPNDSGVIHTTHVFIRALSNAKVTATLYTIYLNRTVSTQVAFTVAGGTPGFAGQYEFGKELTGEIRAMADRDNQPYGGTILAEIVNGSGSSVANCTLFTAVLLQLIQESRVGLTARSLGIGLRDDGYDTHELVEVLDDISNRWVTLDPTFGLVSLRADGTPATSGEISAAARAQTWSALTFEFLTPAGSFYANDYYIDYPLLFMIIETPDETGLVQAPPASLAAYFDSLPLPFTGATATFSLKCSSGYSSAAADLNGVANTLPCSGSDQLTQSFLADDIQATDAGSSVAWRLRRFTF
jgi:hypothetical protein